MNKTVEEVYQDVVDLLNSKYDVFVKTDLYQVAYSPTTGKILLRTKDGKWGGSSIYKNFKTYSFKDGASQIVGEIEKDLKLKEGVEMENTITEAKSKWLTALEKSNRSAFDLYNYRNQLIGAVGSGELESIVVGALKTATAYLEFVYKIMQDAPELSESESVKRALGNAIVAAGRVKIMESVEEQDETIYVDPYEAEYLPANLLTEAVPQEITESVNEDAEPLPDDLDDDPDALITTDTEGMPVKFNNTPLDLDPFAVRLFRNNAELIDPPEVFSAVADAEETTEPELDPGVASDETVDDATREEFIDVVADTAEDGEKEKEIPAPSVELPSDDFDVFANESKIIPTSTVTPKNTDSILPPQFAQTEAKRANENIDHDPGNNLKMLAFLANADI